MSNKRAKILFVGLLLGLSLMPLTGGYTSVEARSRSRGSSSFSRPRSPSRSRTPSFRPSRPSRPTIRRAPVSRPKPKPVRKPVSKPVSKPASKKPITPAKPPVKPAKPPAKPASVPTPKPTVAPASSKSIQKKQLQRPGLPKKPINKGNLKTPGKKLTPPKGPNPQPTVAPASSKSIQKKQLARPKKPNTGYPKTGSSPNRTPVRPAINKQRLRARPKGVKTYSQVQNKVRLNPNNRRRVNYGGRRAYRSTTVYTTPIFVDGYTYNRYHYEDRYYGMAWNRPWWAWNQPTRYIVAEGGASNTIRRVEQDSPWDAFWNFLTVLLILGGIGGLVWWALKKKGDSSNGPSYDSDY